jgi:hypothetical protein
MIHPPESVFSRQADSVFFQLLAIGGHGGRVSFDLLRMRLKIPLTHA